MSIAYPRTTVHRDTSNVSYILNIRIYDHFLLEMRLRSTYVHSYFYVYWGIQSHDVDFNAPTTDRSYTCFCSMAVGVSRPLTIKALSVFISDALASVWRVCASRYPCITQSLEGTRREENIARTKLQIFRYRESTAVTIMITLYVLCFSFNSFSFVVP